MRILNYNPLTKQLTFIDPNDHTSTVDVHEARFATTASGETDLTKIVLTCPVPNCFSMGMVPIGLTVVTTQKLFIYKIRDNQPGRTWEQAKTLVKSMVADGFWVCEGVQDGE